MCAGSFLGPDKSTQAEPKNAREQPGTATVGSHLGRGSGLHLHDEQRLVGVAFDHLAGLFEDSLLDVGLVGAVQVIHGLLQAL